MSRINWPIWLLAIFYVTLETWYFGWHMVPQSDAEVIADGIGITVFALAVRSFRISQSGYGG